MIRLVKKLNKKQLATVIGTALVIADQLANTGVFPQATAIKILSVTGVLSAVLPKLFGDVAVQTPGQGETDGGSVR